MLPPRNRGCKRKCAEAATTAIIVLSSLGHADQWRAGMPARSIAAKTRPAAARSFGDFGAATAIAYPHVMEQGAALWMRSCISRNRLRLGGAMKCPNCDTELVQKKRDGVDMEICLSCQGMWLSRQELAQLEDEVFDFGDDEKGSLMLGSAPTTRKCPQCGELMKSFEYRLYDLELVFCEQQHGYWLDPDEDKRVLQLMKEEETNLGRKVLAEDRFAAHLRYLRSGSFLDRIRDLATEAMDPKPKPAF